jgi:hypothetical protein
VKSFPYSTRYINEVFAKEEKRLDYAYLRPPLLIFYFFLRLVVFPLKFFVHRGPYGFEARCIDGVLALGMKYFASYDAVELMVRHVQIEPLLYRHLLGGGGEASAPESARKLNGIDGDYNLGYLSEMLSKAAMETTKRSSLQWIGCTNVVIFIVITITLFADLRTAMKALNSFGSDSLLLWSLKNLYADDPIVSTDPPTTSTSWRLWRPRTASVRGRTTSASWRPAPPTRLWWARGSRACSTTGWRPRAW